MNEKQSKATPGPWVAECVGDTGGENPVEVWEVIAGGYVRVAEGLPAADAHLIAAAPDLRDVAEQALAAFSYLKVAAKTQFDRDEFARREIAARAAITKATQGD